MGHLGRYQGDPWPPLPVKMRTRWDEKAPASPVSPWGTWAGNVSCPWDPPGQLPRPISGSCLNKTVMRNGTCFQPSAQASAVSAWERPTAGQGTNQRGGGRERKERVTQGVVVVVVEVGVAAVVALVAVVVLSSSSLSLFLLLSWLWLWLWL